MYVYKCGSVRDLLMRCHAIAMTSDSGRWNFRGQRDSRWTLLPSLLREPEKKGIANPQEFESRLVTNMRRVLRERTTFSARIIDDDDIVLAIGQHYGVSTRLLDWTHDPNVALYFAAADVLRGPQDEAASLSVFAMADLYLNVGQSGRGASFVHPPRAANPNLAAQRGLLTKHAWDAPDLWDRSQEKLATDPVHNVTARMDTRLVRFDLPQREAARALQTLLNSGVDGSVLFPTEYGIARLAEELARLDLLVTAGP